MLFLDQLSNYFLSDVNISLQDEYPIAKIEQYALTIPGVEKVEGWTAAGANLLARRRFYRGYRDVTGSTR